ncbi:MAG: SPASM domain-containing protein, partial [Chloroflexota bacterium]
TVNSVNGDHPLEVYRFIRDEIGADWMQFIPVVERINEDGRTLYQQGDSVSDRSVRSEQFGRFLSAIFDEWVRYDVGRIYVQTFEAALRNWLGLDQSGMCVFNETCGQGLAIEHNGDLYACDHFVEPDFFLGNIQQEHMIEMVASSQQLAFGQDKLDTLPQYCLDCDVRFACHGECPKNRFITTPPGEDTPDGERGLNYLCTGFKHFFRHVDFPMKLMAGLIRRRRPAEEVMSILAMEEKKWLSLFAQTGRNQPCPCGSGRKFKQCHVKPGAGVPLKVAPIQPSRTGSPSLHIGTSINP